MKLENLRNISTLSFFRAKGEKGSREMFVMENRAVINAFLRSSIKPSLFELKQGRNGRGEIADMICIMQDTKFTIAGINFYMLKGDYILAG